LEDVPGCDDEVFQNEVVEDIKEVEEADDENGGVDVAKFTELLGSNREVNENPPSQAWARLREELDIEAERVVVKRVKFNSEPQVVREVAHGDLFGGVLSLDEQIEGKDEGEDVGDPQQFQEVVSQQRHLPTGNDMVSIKEETKGDDKGSETVASVLESAATFFLQGKTMVVSTGNDNIQYELENIPSTQSVSKLV